MVSWTTAIVFTSALTLFGAHCLKPTDNNDLNNEAEEEDPSPCTCGVFLSGQFMRGSKLPPKGNPALLQEIDGSFPNSALGNRQCMNKCLEMIAKHLAHSADLICATIDRDCYKERAHLWVKSHNSNWFNTNLSAGREFCCKDNEPYKCSQGPL